ncbi:hypothetical protein IDH50_01945 [Aeromicrobium tamlense]|uniref:Uncharacterized protein n=1 Tax=Aeromicrobium tamlense TaxID=375541 RepID=A0A8I0KH20_9ACTN|nr:hypothetical protein [Aeromicrobium tamlense]MBD1268985.1 hypothetical protein [Aeromicrobium tamlense]NYI37107.1 hypothetical protein [Aeromicrobium tamlense]
MGRIEWAALGGDEVETVLANLLYNANSRSIRVRPAQGDYGIDVLVPAGADAKPWDVYQIKKFATNLGDTQKRQIEGSFRRVLIGLVRAGIPLNHWYLVTPLDPTLANLEWFESLPEAAIAWLKAVEEAPLSANEEAEIRAWLDAPGRQIEWKGLPYCESLVAEYPYVVDYYLHGGERRIRDAVKDVAKLLQRDVTLPRGDVPDAPGEGSAALLDPADVREHFERLDKVLETDPHYSYGFGIEPHRRQLAPEPGLVAATQEQLAGGRWLTFKVFQRSAQSVDERPIPIQLEFKIETPEDREAFEIWRKYGKPTVMNAAFKIDLPGGLGGEGDSAQVRLSPAAGEEVSFRNRLRILNPNGDVLGELGFAMTATRGIGGTGNWSRGIDDSRTLETEGFFHVETVDGLPAGGGKMNFSLQPLAGLEAFKAVAAVTFGSHLVAPNRLEVAGEFGPFQDFCAIEALEPLVHPAVARIVRALSVIQSRTPIPVTIPDFSALEPEDVRAIRDAAFLIEGNTTVGTWPELVFDIAGDMEIDIGGHYQFAVIKPLVVHLNGHDLALGAVEHTLLSANVSAIDGDVVHATPHLNDTVHAKFVTDVPSAPAGRDLVRGRAAPDPIVPAEEGDHDR